MGWLVMAAIAASAYAVLRLGRMPRVLDSFVAAALLLGGAGYAWQQQASLPGRPTSATAQGVEVDPGMVAFRRLIQPGTADDARIMAAADDRLRRGETAAAVQLLLEAIGQRPNEAALWTGLGSALAAHDGGQLSPAAGFAFRRAWQLAPDQPGPPFFLGLAYIQGGNLDAAKTAWLRALRLTPRDARYRVDIAERLVLIDEFKAMSAGGGASPSGGR